MRFPRLRAAVLLIALGAGCKHPQHFTDAGPDPDGQPIDGNVAIDAAPPAPGQEITTGGGRVSSTGYVLDVQVGHGVSQQPTQSPSFHLEGNAPVKP